MGYSSDLSRSDGPPASRESSSRIPYGRQFVLLFRSFFDYIKNVPAAAGKGASHKKASIASVQSIMDVENACHLVRGTFFSLCLLWTRGRIIGGLR